MMTKRFCCLLLLKCLLLGYLFNLTGATNDCIFNEHSNTAISSKTDICCGPNKKLEPYFLRTQICCNGTVHDRTGRLCCKGKLYDPTQRICCDELLYDKKNKVCCGSKLHTVTTHQVTCCGGELHDNSQGCCGGLSLYNESSQICCVSDGSFSIATKENSFCCYDKAFDVRSQYCVNDQVLSHNENLCDMEKYNISEKKCCGDQTLYDMPQFQSDCCGSQLYDVNQSQCCKGTKTVIPTNLECCGEGSFNESTHFCCNSFIKSKEDGSRCCGPETIDVTEGCCGAKAYNLSTHQCCKDSTIIPEHHRCRGYRGYDNRTQLCTDNYKVINRTKNKDCANTSKSRNNKRRRVSRSICNTCLWRFRRIYREIKSGNQNVCKRHTYNITIIDTKICRKKFWILYAKYENRDRMESNVEIIVPCKSEKLNKTGDYLLVTDITIDGETLRLGDSDLLIQRHYKLFKLVERKQSRCRHVPVGPIMPQYLADCCGSQLYDVNQSECCRETKTVIPNNLKCCGEVYFNESSQLCCNGVIKSKEDGSRCCGSETVDATEGCCGTKAYKLSTHQCCKNETIILLNQPCGNNGDGDRTQCCNNQEILYTTLNCEF